MKLIEVILRDENLEEAIKRVKSNKGVPGIDKMTVNEIDAYFKTHKEQIKKQILEKKYKPQPVRRVYIPKSNGKKRPLGIPTVVDRVIQQAIAQILSEIYDSKFSEDSFGFRPNRSAHDAIMRTLDYLNEGYEWVIDLDIEAYFDTVNHDKLISILREHVNDSTTLHLIRKFLQAGIMENERNAVCCRDTQTEAVPVGHQGIHSFEHLATFHRRRIDVIITDGQDLRPVHLMGDDPVQGNYRQECRQVLQVLTDGRRVVSTIRGTVERGILPLAATTPACGREGCHTGLSAEKLILQQFLICRQTTHCFSSSQSSSYS